MVYRIESFCVILYIVILSRIVLESLGIRVSNDFIFTFYIYKYVNGLSILYYCRSPPISMNFLENLCWLEVFIMSKNVELEDDIVFAKFLKYMQKALYHRSLNYYRDFKRNEEWEVELKDIEDTSIEKSTFDEIESIKVLTKKDVYLLDMHYKRGLSYAEISKITGEKVGTLKQRRNRAILKLKDNMEE